jgi:hypothetical protein
MSVEETEVDIHIDQDESWYDGDYTIKCAVTLSSPDTNGKKITVPYGGTDKDIIQGQVFKDIKAYLEDPEGWARKYILGGQNEQEKLREYEAEAAECRKDIASYKSSIEWKEKNLKQYEEAIYKLKVNMEYTGKEGDVT